MNDKANPQRAINRRIHDVEETVKTLDLYWKNGAIPCKEKLIVYDVIVRSELFYGLESAQINDSVFKARIDPF